ncbi:MAG: transposase [Oscillospiraceae bacterium]|nr:transposase [Oscillospiraceae bacterium]
MTKSYKIRLMPTEEQERLLRLHVDAMRFVWNWGLALNMERFKQGEKHLNNAGLGKILTEMKKDDIQFKWLNDVSRHTMIMGLIDLSNAYTRFFAVQKKGEKYSKEKIKKFKRLNKRLTPYEMIGHPKFKSRHKAEPKFYARHENLYLQKDFVNIEKIGKVKYQANYKDLPVVSKKRESTTRYINPRVKYINDKWILSFGIECESTKQELNDYSIGIDLGVKELAVISYNGESKSFKNINKTKRVRKLKKRLKQKQRNVSRKTTPVSAETPPSQKGAKKKTTRLLKEEAKVKQLHRKIANIRHNHTHHVTSEIIKLNPRSIVLEDLNVSGMMKNKHLSKAIQEQTLHEFRRQIEYKAEWAGIEVITADRFYPSSKKCSVCGNIKRDLKLKDRVYKCDECGLSINRDVNAAKNLEKLAV